MAVYTTNNLFKSSQMWMMNDHLGFMQMKCVLSMSNLVDDFDNQTKLVSS